jgi:hypothetical protein
MRPTRSRWFKRTAVAAAVAAAAVLVIGAGLFAAFVLMYGFDTNKTQRVSGGGTQVASIELSGFDVTPGTLEVNSGTHLVLEVLNRGDQAHDLAVDGGVRSRKLNAGESQRLDLGPISQAMQMSCTQSWHEFVGMKLHIRIVEPPANASEMSQEVQQWAMSFSR